MGLRRIEISVYLIEKMLREGWSGYRPIDVPDDLELLDVRMKAETKNQVVELLVKSKTLHGDAETFDQAPPWRMTMRRA